MAKWTDVMIGMETLGNKGNIVLDESPDFPHGFDTAFAKLLWPMVLFQTQWSIVITERWNTTTKKEC